MTPSVLSNSILALFTLQMSNSIAMFTSTINIDGTNEPLSDDLNRNMESLEIGQYAGPIVIIGLFMCTCLIICGCIHYKKVKKRKKKQQKNKTITEPKYSKDAQNMTIDVQHHYDPYRNNVFQQKKAISPRSLLQLHRATLNADLNHQLSASAFSYNSSLQTIQYKFTNTNDMRSIDSSLYSSDTQQVGRRNGGWFTFTSSAQVSTTENASDFKSSSDDIKETEITEFGLKELKEDEEWKDDDKNTVNIDKMNHIIHPDYQPCVVGDGGIIVRNDIYELHQFINHNKPSYVAIPVQWIRKNMLDYSGVSPILCDDGWHGEIPVVHATRANVQFYGCILDPLPTDNITLGIKCSNGGIFDFDYSAKNVEERGHFKRIGCSLETHKYAHIETALCNERESGLLIIGKELENEDVLCLTAFIIAKGQTLYIPPETIHSSDYQKGKWRSYSEIDDETIIGSLVRKSKNKENVFLRFYDDVTKERLRGYEIGMDDKDNLDEKDVDLKFVHFHDDSTKLLSERIHSEHYGIPNDHYRVQSIHL